MKERTWSDELVERLKTLSANGVSPIQIARELGLNRNQVAGKRARLGLATPSTRPRMKRRPRKPPTKPAAPTKAALSRNVTIEGLTWEGMYPTNCRAIVTQDHERPTLYCGLPVVRCESWCPDHYRRFRNPGGSR